MKRKTLLVSVVATFALAYVGAMGLLYVSQRSIMYPRNPARAELPKSDIAGIEQLKLETSDGESLVVWSVPPAPGKPVLLFFHGNANHFNRPHVERFKAMTSDGTGLFAVNYRGYGGSTGAPSEEGLHTDARAAYQAAVARYGAKRLVAYGVSLGSGVAVRLAAENPVSALILEAPYLSTLSLAQASYPIFPISVLMKDQFRSDLQIQHVRVPLLILHGTEDPVIPIAQGKALFALANEPKMMVALKGGGHFNLYAYGALPAIRSFLARYVPLTPQTTTRATH